MVTWRFIVALAFLLMPMKMLCASKFHKTDEERKLCLRHSPKHLNSFLWRVDATPPSYLFGTIHVRYDYLWNYIPKNMKYALRSAESLYTELNFNNRSTLDALNKCRFLSGNKTLRDILPSTLYTRLRRHLERVRKTLINWLPAQYRNPIIAANVFQLLTRSWERRGPIWIVILVMNDLTPSGVMSNQREALDIYLGNKAERQRKHFRGLEDVSDQCNPFNQLEMSEAVFLLNHTLNLQELYLQDEVRRRHSMEQNALVEHYKCGNLKSLLEQTGKLLPPLNITPILSKRDKERIMAIDQYFIDELLQKRNLKMASRIEDVLRSRQRMSTFFALGVGHFFGNGSIIEHLRNRGFKVLHVSPTEKLAGQVADEARRKRRRDRRKQHNKSFEIELRRKLDSYEANVKRVETLLNKTRKTPQKHVPQQVHIYKRIRQKNTYVYYYSSAAKTYAHIWLQAFFALVTLWMTLFCI